MRQAIEQRRRHFGIPEDARPLGEGQLVATMIEALVKSADQVEEQLPAGLREGGG
jgi:hypothetical protein